MRNVAYTREMKSPYTIFVINSEGNSLFGRHWSGWKDNNKIELRAMGPDDMNWIRVVYSGELL